jgi:flagellar hook-associated protein 2
MSTSGISFSGLASGLDTKSIIEALVSVAKQPETLLQAKRSDYSSQASLLSTLEGKLTTLQSAAKALDTSAEMRALSASSSDEAKLTASASGSAVVGDYEITVNSLCQAQRTYSDAFAAKDQKNLVGTGTLQIKVGTADAVSISIDGANDTLEDVAARINEKCAGVSVRVMSTGSQYRLVVNGTETGAANTITFSEDGTLATGLDDAANLVQAAADASISFDGMTLTRSTNTIDDAIPGVTLDLVSKTEAGSPVSLSVSTDESTMESKIQTLLSAYNDVVGFINGQLTYSGEVKTDTLMGDSTTRSVKYRLQRIIASEVPGLGESFSSLARIGIKTATDGKLSLDSSTFHDALTSNLEAVSSLFSASDGDSSTDNDGIAVALVRALDGMLRSTDGLLPARESGLAARIADIDKQLTRLEDNVTTYQEGLQRQYTALEELLAGLQSQSTFLTQNFS